MTIEERFERIEHFTAGWFEQSPREWEENRQMWRDTQRQIDELTRTVARFAEESRAADEKLRQQIAEVRLNMAALDRKTDERIQALVSAIGEMAKNK